MLVLNVGGPVDLSPVAEEIGNILLLSQLGTETGAVLADILLGKSNPSGKLTTTWAACRDYPSIGDFGDRDNTRYKEGIYVGYRYFDSAGVKPLFPFGYGLSYTEFEYSDLRIETDEAAGTAKVRITVQNVGNMIAKHTVLLFLTDCVCRLTPYVRRLRGFEKIELAPGESRVLEFTLGYDDFFFINEKMEEEIEHGEYFVEIGGQTGRFTL